MVIGPALADAAFDEAAFVVESMSANHHQNLDSATVESITLGIIDSD